MLEAIAITVVSLDIQDSCAESTIFCVGPPVCFAAGVALCSDLRCGGAAESFGGQRFVPVESPGRMEELIEAMMAPTKALVASPT